MPFWAQGLGESSGDSLVTEGSLDMTGTVWYVHHTGSDSNGGQDRVRPFATVGHAVSEASGGDIIVCLSGHTETIATSVEINKAGLVLVGAGTAGGKPTVKLTSNLSEGNGMLYVTQPVVRIRNIWFTENAEGSNKPKVRVANNGTDPNAVEIDGCYFECGTDDSVGALGLGTGSNYFRITGTTFICTAAASTDPQPLTAVYIDAAPYGGYMADTVFDGGVDGFGSFWAFAHISGGDLLEFQFERISLLRGADLALLEDDTGRLQVSVAQGGARVDWA